MKQTPLQNTLNIYLAFFVVLLFASKFSSGFAPATSSVSRRHVVNDVQTAGINIGHPNNSNEGSFGIGRNDDVYGYKYGHGASAVVVMNMGWFDGIAKAFANEDFKSKDQRVRASHILIKNSGTDDDIDAVLGKVMSIMKELNERTTQLQKMQQQQQDPNQLNSIFAELARRESQCPSATKGGDLGMFGPGAMVKEFDLALFPEDDNQSPPPGSIVGPVITDFGAHIILVTQRDENKDQVEEKLARIDPDAVM